MFKYIAESSIGDQRPSNDDITRFFRRADIYNFVGDIAIS